MKRTFFTLIVALAAVLSASAQTRVQLPGTVEEAAPTETHILVAYFSATGRTDSLAHQIAEQTGGRLWQILPMEPYTAEDLDYRNALSRSSREMKSPDERPTIKMCTDIRPYSVIFLGYPIWWNEAPRIIMSWMDNNILEGKTIVPFATSGGSDIEHSVEMLRRAYPDVKIVDGRCWQKSDPGAVRDFVKDYLPRQ